MNVDTCYRGIEPFIRLFASGSEDSQVLELDSAVASVIPASPKRSLFSSLVFDRTNPESLVDALPKFTAAVDAAGVEASSVWVIEGDERAEQLVTEHGYTLDSVPRAMGAAFSEIDLGTDVGNLAQRWDMATVATLNELAYDLPAGQFGAVLDSLPQQDNVKCFIAMDGDEAVASVISLLTDDGDCAIYFVATHPEHRRRGHARRALVAALKDAEAAGCETTTLQATKHGAPLYALLGYNDLGVAANLWERRTS